jgi:hypothetical protein
VRASTSPITEVTSIHFIEVDTTPELNILIEDSTYISTNLNDGDVVSFTSILNKLDPNMPLEDQLEYVPSIVVLVLFVMGEEGILVQNTVAWGYGGKRIVRASR